MAMTTEEFHDELEAQAHRTQVRSTVTSAVSTVLLLALVVWAIYTTERVRESLEQARAVQRVTAEQNRLQTELLCLAEQREGLAPPACDGYLPVRVVPSGYGESAATHTS